MNAIEQRYFIANFVKLGQENVCFNPDGAICNCCILHGTVNPANCISPAALPCMLISGSVCIKTKKQLSLHGKKFRLVENGLNSTTFAQCNRETGYYLDRKIVNEKS